MSQGWDLVSETSSGSERGHNSNAESSTRFSGELISDHEPMSEDESRDEPNHRDVVHNQPKPKRQNKAQELSKYLRGKPCIPVGRIHNYLRKNNYANRISRKAAAALSGTLQGLVIELIIATEKFTRESNKKRISPRHISLAIQSDRQFTHLLPFVTIPEGGVIGKYTNSLRMIEMLRDNPRNLTN